jgi:hypothetical protein
MNRTSALIIIGGLIGAMGWLVGLKLSEFSAQQFGISVGAWLITSIFIFSIVAYQLLTRKKIITGILIFIMGLFIGICIEIIQLLPAFVASFKYMDFQAFAVMSAFVLIVPFVNIFTPSKTR